MGKLRVLSGADVLKILSDHGFKKVRQRGSHIIMQKIFENSTITIPVPDHREIRLGTLKSIIRQSCIESRFFESN